MENDAKIFQNGADTGAKTHLQLISKVTANTEGEIIKSHFFSESVETSFRMWKRQGSRGLVAERCPYATIKKSNDKSFPNYEKSMFEKVMPKR